MFYSILMAKFFPLGGGGVSFGYGNIILKRVLGVVRNIEAGPIFSCFIVF